MVMSCTKNKPGFAAGLKNDSNVVARRLLSRVQAQEDQSDGGCMFLILATLTILAL
jgi:hypothetical protein